jgi:hypothetical protein
VGGLDARTTTLEGNTASLTQSGADVTLNTTGNVDFEENGTAWMFYAQPNGALVLSPPIAVQSRGRHDFYDSTPPLSLLARFDGDAGTITFQAGKTFTCNATATFASTVSSAFASSIRQGTSTVSTSTGGTSYTYGGFTYKEFVYAISYGYTFSSAPRVHVTTSSASPSIIRVSATDVTTTGFNLRILDANDPSTSVSTEWLAIL